MFKVFKEPSNLFNWIGSFASVTIVPFLSNMEQNQHDKKRNLELQVEGHVRNGNSAWPRLGLTSVAGSKLNTRITSPFFLLDK